MKRSVMTIAIALAVGQGALQSVQGQRLAWNPTGTLGLQFACSRCEVVTDWNSGTRKYHFSEPPVIMGVTEQGPAAAAGVQVGDTITHIDNISLLTDEGGLRFGNIRAGTPLVLTVQRDGRPLQLSMTPRARDGVDTEIADRVQKIIKSLGANRSDATTTTAKPLYTGTFAGVDVRVDGPGKVTVTVAADCMLTIAIGSQTVTLRHPETCSG